MSILLLSAATTVVVGLWLAMLGTFWGRPQHLDTTLTHDQRRRRKDAGSRLVGLGAVLLAVGFVGLTLIGLVVGWRWAL